MSTSAPDSPAIALHEVLSDEGLRLFFPLGALFAALWPAQWVLVFGLNLPLVRQVPPAFWHAHEMIFGIFGAALLGFISTAVPEWTDTRRPRGRFLFPLAALWLGGRLVGFLGADAINLLGALCDAGWLIGLAGYVLRIAWLKRTDKLLGFLFWISALAVCQLAIRWAFQTGDLALAQRLLHDAGFIFLALLGLALARISVAVNNQILDPSEETSPYRPHPGRINLASGLLAVLIAAELAGASQAVSGYLLIAAGAAFMDRASENFIGRATWRAEILILVLASLLAGLGLILLGLGRIGMPVPPIASLHLAFMGGLGVGIFAVFSIAGLLHTGQKLAFKPAVRWALALLLMALAARLVPLLGVQAPGSTFWHASSALLWAAAFLTWLRSYWPLLSGAWTLELRRERADLEG